MERTWGGETRQVFTLDVAGTGRHVWNVGDGALIRHAVNPGTGVTWTVQDTPSDVTQNLLDVHFIEGGASGPPHLGFAVGVNGHVLTSPDYGTTWVHLDSGEVQNQLSPTENATLWRGRFLNEDDGFVAGLWTFKRWDGATSAWTEPTLKNPGGFVLSANLFEFYALEILVDPNDPDVWTGVLAGQRWSIPGGGHASSGSVFYASSAVDNGNTWTEVFNLSSLPGPGLTSYQDPWDIAFEPNPSSPSTAVGYLCAGTGTSEGAVFRTANGGQTWNPSADLADTATLYGIGALGSDDAFAVGYAGQVWVRDSSGWTCRRGTPCTLPPTVTETQTAPLAGAHGAGSDMYATGSWGYLHVSQNGFVTDTIELDPSSSDGNYEHWRFGDVHFTTATDGYAVSANKTIIETIDGGVQWELSTSSPNSLTGTNTEPLQAVDFRNGGGNGVAAGWGEVRTLAPLTAPTLQQAFAYWKHETLSPSWTASQLRFAPTREWLLLGDVAWATGSGPSAEFWAVGIAGNGVNPYTVSSRIPMLLRSGDGGRTWTDANSAAGGIVPAAVRLNAIAFRSTTEGFAVGWNTSTSTSVAYRIDLSGAAPAIAPVGISGGAANELLDVTGNASYVAACGKNGTLLVFNGVSFVPSGVPALGFASPPDLLCISAPPGGGLRTLVGVRTSVQEVDAPGLGKMLYYDGGWKVIDAATNKGVSAVQLRDSGGFGLAGGSGVPNSGEFGIVADSASLRFVEPGP